MIYSTDMMYRTHTGIHTVVPIGVMGNLSVTVCTPTVFHIIVQYLNFNLNWLQVPVWKYSFILRSEHPCALCSSHGSQWEGEQVGSLHEDVPPPRRGSKVPVTSWWLKQMCNELRSKTITYIQYSSTVVRHPRVGISYVQISNLKNLVYWTLQCCRGQSMHINLIFNYHTVKNTSAHLLVVLMSFIQVLYKYLFFSSWTEGSCDFGILPVYGNTEFLLLRWLSPAWNDFDGSVLGNNALAVDFSEVSPTWNNDDVHFLRNNLLVLANCAEFSPTWNDFDVFLDIAVNFSEVSPTWNDFDVPFLWGNNVLVDADFSELSTTWNNVDGRFLRTNALAVTVNLSPKEVKPLIRLLILILFSMSTSASVLPSKGVTRMHGWTI